jgi:hypothetical protein
MYDLMTIYYDYESCFETFEYISLPSCIDLSKEVDWAQHRLLTSSMKDWIKTILSESIEKETQL